jgi:hypothetical protein
MEDIMTQFPLDIAAANAATLSVQGHVTSIWFDTLCGVTSNLDLIAGVLAFTVLAVLAITWLTAAPTPRRLVTNSRNHAAPGAAAMI